MSRPLGPTAPTIGRVVHIAHDEHGAIPAIVTGVIDRQTIHATAFPPGKQPLAVIAEHVEPGHGLPKLPAGTWHWPPIR